jgi:hypothetical protein
MVEGLGMVETMSLPLSNGRLLQVRFCWPVSEEDITMAEKSFALLVQSMREHAK